MFYRKICCFLQSPVSLFCRERFYMFQVNENVIYGNHGVCRITDCGKLSISIADKDKMYYTLQPIYQNETVIYAPVDNCRIVMRYVMSKEDVEELIREIPDIETLWVVNERERELQYKTALKSCDCRELVKIIKTIYKRREARIQNGKKVTAIDERYYRMVADQLNGELAFVLNIDKDNVDSYISSRLHQEKIEN